MSCTDEATLTDITLMEATLRGVPLAGIPLAGIPLAGIDFRATPLAGIPLAGIEFQSTPLAGIPLAGIPLAGIELADSPLAGIPLAEIPLAGIPLAGIPLAGIDINGTPLAGISLADIPLAGIATSTPLAGLPLAGIDLEGAPLAGIPLAGIELMDSPLAGIPLAGIGATPAENEAAWCRLLLELGAPETCDSGVSVGSTTLFEIAAQGVPLAGIPLAGIDVNGLPLAGIPLAGISLADIPLAGIPLAGISLAGIPLAGIDLIGTPLAGIPLADIPLAGIDIKGSPLAGIPLAGIDLIGSPLAGIPLAGIPLAGIPLDGIPLAGIPLAGIDLTGTPLAGIGNLMSVPLAGIDVKGSPLAGIPLAGIQLAGIPLAGIGIDCTTGVVNCEFDSLGDAVAAGAVDLDTTLLDLQPSLGGLTLGDIAAHIDGLTFDDVRTVVNDADLQLGDLTDLDGLTLGDLPATDPAFDTVTLGLIEQQLINVSFADLIGALLDPATGEPIDSVLLDSVLRDAIDSLSLNADQLTVLGDVTLGDFIGGAAGANLRLDDLGRILGLISVESILIAYGIDPATAPPLTGNLGDLTDPDQLGDLTLADLVGVNEFGIIDTADFLVFLDSLGLLDGFDIGDLLLGLVDATQLPFGGFDFTDVETGNLPAGTVADVTFLGSFTVADSVVEQVVEISAIVPTTAAYIDRSSTLTVTSGGSPGAPVEIVPVVDGNTLSWTIDGVVPGDDYDIEFDVRPEIDLGSSVINASARIVGADAQDEAFGAVQVLEGLEPNDFTDGVTVVADDTIYLTYVSDATDIDVFQVTLQENDVLAIELSDLAADFDVALYGDPTDVAVGSALSGISGNAPVIPIKDPDQTGADAEPLDDFTRLDEIDADLDLLQVSNSTGTANELIVTDRLPAGTYYIQVFGSNGVSSPKPAALQIQIDDAEVRPECQAVGPIGAAPGATNSITTNTNTLFLVNEMRLEHFNSAAERAQVMSELNQLVDYLNDPLDNLDFGVNAAVVAVDGNPNVLAAYEAWDDADGSNPEAGCDPNFANGVVAAINDNIIDPVRDQIDYIVMIGGDDQIPMARLEDATEVANEYDYRHEFDGDLNPNGQDPDGANAFTSVAWESRILSDEPYGESAAQSLGSRFLYVSDIALGRLVESPAEIIRALDDFETYEGSLDTTTGDRARLRLPDRRLGSDRPRPRGQSDTGRQRRRHPGCGAR